MINSEKIKILFQEAAFLGNALLLMSLGYLATDIYLPALPAIVDFYHVENASAQLTISYYLLGFALVPLIAGPLADTFGRKKVMGGGLLCGFVATAACWYAPTIETLIAMRCIQGISLGMTVTAARVLIPDTYTGSVLSEKMSYITMSMPIVLSCAPLLGGYLNQKFGWHSIFIFLISYIAGLILILAGFRETLKKPQPFLIRNVFNQYVEFLQQRLFLCRAVLVVLPVLGIFSFLTTTPFIFQNTLGLSSIEYGMLSFYIGASILLSSLINGRLVRFIPETYLIFLGACCAVIAGIWLLGAKESVQSLLGASMLYFCCVGFCMPNSFSQALNDIKQHLGAATALLSTLQFLVGSLGSWIFSWLPNSDSMFLGIGYLVVGIGMILTQGYLRFSSCTSRTSDI